MQQIEWHGPQQGRGRALEMPARFFPAPTARAWVQRMPFYYFEENCDLISRGTVISFIESWNSSGLAVLRATVESYSSLLEHHFTSRSSDTSHHPPSHLHAQDNTRRSTEYITSPTRLQQNPGIRGQWASIPVAQRISFARATTAMCGWSAMQCIHPHSVTLASACLGCSRCHRLERCAKGAWRSIPRVAAQRAFFCQRS